jgi:hypothetical protein
VAFPLQLSLSQMDCCAEATSASLVRDTEVWQNGAAGKACSQLAQQLAAVRSVSAQEATDQEGPDEDQDVAEAATVARLAALSHPLLSTASSTPKDSGGGGGGGGGGGSYRLMAVVRHVGATAAVGHYVCDTSSQKKWLRHNDSVVTELSQEAVLAEQASPYILFYVSTDLK